MDQQELTTKFLGLRYVEQLQLLRLAIATNKTKQLSCYHELDRDYDEDTELVCPECGYNFRTEEVEEFEEAYCA